jgi:hypothetical protein
VTNITTFSFEASCVFVTSDRTCPLIGQSLPRGAGLGGHVPNPSAVESGVEALDKYRWLASASFPATYIHSITSSTRRMSCEFGTSHACISTGVQTVRSVG